MEYLSRVQYFNYKNKELFKSLQRVKRIDGILSDSLGQDLNRGIRITHSDEQLDKQWDTRSID